MRALSERRERQRGFSLIEILIAASILSVVGVAVYSTFGQGLRLWQRAVSLQPDIDSEVLFEKMTADLRRSYRNGDGLQGGALEMRFSAFPAAGTGAGKIEYRWNADGGFLERMETDLWGLLQTETYGEPLFRPVTEAVKGVRFEYYHEDPKNKSFVWKDFWKQKCLPKAVRISLKYDDLNKIEPKTRIIALPAGGCPGEGAPV